MFGVYVHIPYCVRKCRYCDFPSVPVGESRPADYLRALRLEMENSSEENPPPADTVYCGGGTPSILSGEDLSFLFKILHHSIKIKNTAEITVEINPGTVDEEKANHLRSLGVNRISLGIQSFNDETLKGLGRNHSGKEGSDSFTILRTAGFENIGLDLMYGLPGQNVDAWKRDLEQAFDLQPKHISLYALGLEKGTPMHHDAGRGLLSFPPDEDVVEMYNLGCTLSASAGFRQYEISNFAVEGFHSRHNSLVWEMHPYVGVGAGAHSFLTIPVPMRRWNVMNPDVYIKRLQSGKSPAEGVEHLSNSLLAGEALMLGLRRLEGVRISDFRRRYSLDPIQLLEEVSNEGGEEKWIEIAGGRIRLTHKGRLFSNEVFVHLF